MHMRTAAALECGHLLLQVQVLNCYFQHSVKNGPMAKLYTGNMRKWEMLKNFILS